MMEATDANSQHQHRAFSSMSHPLHAPGCSGEQLTDGVHFEPHSTDATGSLWDSFWANDQLDAGVAHRNTRPNPWVSLQQASMSAEPACSR